MQNISNDARAGWWKILTPQGFVFVALVVAFYGNLLLRAAGQISWPLLILSTIIVFYLLYRSVVSFNHLCDRTTATSTFLLPVFTRNDLIILVPLILLFESLKFGGVAVGFVGNGPAKPNAAGKAVIREVRDMEKNDAFNEDGVNAIVAKYDQNSAGYQGLRALCDIQYFHDDLANHGDEALLGWPPADVANDPVATGKIWVAQRAHVGKFKKGGFLGSIGGGDEGRLAGMMSIDKGVGGVYAPEEKNFPADSAIGDDRRHCIYMVRLSKNHIILATPERPFDIDVSHVAIVVPEGRRLQLHRVEFHPDFHPQNAYADWHYAPADDYVCISCERYGWCELHEPLF